MRTVLLSGRIPWNPWVKNVLSQTRGKPYKEGILQQRLKAFHRTVVLKRSLCTSCFSLKINHGDSMFYQAAKLSIRWNKAKNYRKSSPHSSSFMQIGNRGKEVLILLLFGLAVGFVYGWSKKLEKDRLDSKMNEINEIIKKAQTFYDKDQKEATVSLYKKALEEVERQIASEAQSHQRMTTLTTKFVFIIDQLANLMHGLGKLKEAEDYYKKTLQAMISHGTNQDDDAVIEISLKLASIYAQESRHELAENGFSWCIESARKKVNKAQRPNVNSAALLGICLESYGKYLLSRKQAVKAIRLFSEALKISRNIFEEGHQQIAMLLNNLGVAYFEAGDVEQSKRCLTEAINLSRKENEEDVWSFHLNLGNVLAQTGEGEEAKREYNKALRLCADETVRPQIKDQLLKLPQTSVQ